MSSHGTPVGVLAQDGKVYWRGSCVRAEVETECLAYRLRLISPSK